MKSHITNLLYKIDRLFKRLAPTFQETLYSLDLQVSATTNKQTEVKSGFESSKNVD